jgi:hypothetical protein
MQPSSVAIRESKRFGARPGAADSAQIMHKSGLPVDCRRSLEAYSFFPEAANTVPSRCSHFTLKKNQGVRSHGRRDRAFFVRSTNISLLPE